MQRLMFIRPPKRERSTPPQELITILVPGKRKPLIKQTLPPTAPRIGGKVYYSTPQVRAGVASGRIAHNLIERTFAAVAAYEKWFSRKLVTRTYPYFEIDKDGERDALAIESVTVHDALNGEDTSDGFHRAKRANKSGTPLQVPTGIFRTYAAGKSKHVPARKRR
jgi:hypothetical protein